MNLVAVRNALAGLNPSGRDNVDGNCTGCAVDAAYALIGGYTPHTQTQGTDTPILPYSPMGEVTTSIPESDDRARTAWRWLLFTGAQGVYIFETGDHSYNIVKDDQNRIYVVDANTHFYKRVTGHLDAIDDVNEDDTYNYLDPEVEDTGYDPIRVHYWGMLHHDWH